MSTIERGISQVPPTLESGTIDPVQVQAENGRTTQNGRREKTRLFMTAARLFAIVMMFLAFRSAPPISADSPGVDTQPVRGKTGDLWADVIIGQPDFSEIAPNTTVPNKLWDPKGAVVDRTGQTDKLYIMDGGNNRILGVDLDKCYEEIEKPNSVGCSPQIVIGQPNFSTSACNGDSGFQHYPERAPASASSLCITPEKALSPGEAISGANMAVDKSGDLYTVDYRNHRVLKYNQPFEEDTVADQVWGQDDFAGNKCNKGGWKPDSSTLCFDWGDHNNTIAGVDVDPSGNVWVADSGNHRVVRYPLGKKEADLVLGQESFISNRAGSGLNQLNSPAAVRIDANGWVYVVDQGNSRVLRFKPPWQNGVSGEVFASSLIHPSGIELDTLRQGIWINNSDNDTIELWDEKGVLKQTISNFGGAMGSIGIDSQGNVITAVSWGHYRHNVLLFRRSDILNGEARKTYSDILFSSDREGGNLRTDRELFAASGVVIADNQLIISDATRLMFWNNPASLTNGRRADGVAGKGVYRFTDRASGSFVTIKADNDHHLWVSVVHDGGPVGHIELYRLPLTHGEQPIKTIDFPLPLAGAKALIDSTHLVYSPELFSGLAVSNKSEFLWVSDVEGNRVLRIRNPISNPVVDVILGQNNPSDTDCNRVKLQPEEDQKKYARADTICHPGGLALDRFGNLYVSDHWLEIYGNYRLLVFPSELFPKNSTRVVYAPAATKIFPDIATFEPAFDQTNRMVVGYNPYWGRPQGDWFPGIYLNPLSPGSDPDAFLKDFLSMAVAAAFDEKGNLYIADSNRSRVLIYWKPAFYERPPDCGNTCIYSQVDARGTTLCYEGNCRAEPCALNINCGWVSGCSSGAQVPCP